MTFSCFSCFNKIDVTFREGVYKMNFELEASKKMNEDNKERVRERERMRKKKYREDNKEKNKEARKKYREDTKEKIKEASKKYRDENKEREAERHKKYIEDNNEKVKEARKKYREENKEKIKEARKNRIICSCGMDICKSSLKRHLTFLQHNKIISFRHRVCARKIYNFIKLNKCLRSFISPV